MYSIMPSEQLTVLPNEDFDLPGGFGRSAPIRDRQESPSLSPFGFVSGAISFVVRQIIYRVMTGVAWLLLGATALFFFGAELREWLFTILLSNF